MISTTPMISKTPAAGISCLRLTHVEDDIERSAEVRDGLDGLLDLRLRRQQAAATASGLGPRGGHVADRLQARGAGSLAAAASTGRADR